MSKRSNNGYIGRNFDLDAKGIINQEKRNVLRYLNEDLIYVNDVSNGAVFGSDETSGLIMDASGEITQVPAISKDTLSDILLDKILVKLG